ncbi:hypothetical protein LXL04_032677 [Taraxacum kok-saghyz]
MVVQIGVMMCEIEGTVFEIVTLLEIVGRVFDTVVVDTVVVDTDTDTVVVFASKLEMPAAIDIAQDRMLGGIPLAAEGCLQCETRDHCEPVIYFTPVMFEKFKEKLSNIRFTQRRLPAVALCRWQRLPLEAAVPFQMPAVNTAIWHAAGFAGSIPSRYLHHSKSEILSSFGQRSRKVDIVSIYIESLPQYEDIGYCNNMKPIDIKLISLYMAQRTKLKNHDFLHKNIKLRASFSLRDERLEDEDERSSRKSNDVFIDTSSSTDSSEFRDFTKFMDVFDQIESDGCRHKTSF